MERRTFLARLGQTLVAVPAVTITLGCGGDDPADPADDGESFTIDSSTDAGHEHTLTLSCASLKGGLVSYFSSDAAGHTHVVGLTFDEVTRILNEESVVATTTSGGHSHTWSIQKPAGLCD